MVGTDAERGGIIKHGAKMIQAVTNARVPKIALIASGSYGAGNYAMCGRGFDPNFIFSWPGSRIAVMGGEQAGKVLRIVTEEKTARAGKAVLIEIPMADTLSDAERLVRVQKETGVVAMAGHVRRFNPSHQWVHKRLRAGELRLQQFNAQTYFFRRTNLNARGEPRSWTDHLLWHHAAHTIDLFQYQCGENISDCYAVQGPIHKELNIAMDMGIVAKTPSGKMLTLSLSFNNDGPLGTFFRYICDNGTYIARYDDLVDGKENKIDVSKVDVSMNGIELQDRESFAAIREGRQPNASVASVLPAYETLDRLEKTLD